MINKRIGIIGCGNMGEALLNRLSTVLEKSTSLMASEIDATRRELLQTKYKIIVQFDNNYLLKNSDVVILAVKPKDVYALLQNEVCCGISKDKLLISIAAGITTKHIESIVGKDIPVIRVMPNMPALIGEAISSISAGSAATKEDVEIAKDIFSTIGEVVEVDEGLVDSVTAISGSGPAYFFYFVEALIQAAKDLGLKEAVAIKLVLKTALGSSKLLYASGEGPDTLIQKVASKGGTTEAALKVFENKKFKNIVKTACRQAYKRSKELCRKWHVCSR